MRGQFSKLKRDTTVFLCESRSPTRISRVYPAPARLFLVSSPWEATTLSLCHCCAASTRPMGLSLSFILTVTCKFTRQSSSDPSVSITLTISRDTWKPKVFGGSPSQVAAINHGTYFYHAAMEGLLKNDTNIHAGIRTTLSGPSDYENDGYCGFEIVEAREIDTIGTDGIIKKIRDRVGTENPVYLSIDIDTLDPACEFALSR